MVNTTSIPSMSGLGHVYFRSLRGVSSCIEVRYLAPANAPMTGAVRPETFDVQTAHLGDGNKGALRVRTWSPPVLA